MVLVNNGDVLTAGLAAVEEGDVGVTDYHKSFLRHVELVERRIWGPTNILPSMRRLLAVMMITLVVFF